MSLFLGPLISKIEKKTMNILVHKPNKNDQNFLKDLFIAGTIVPIIDKRYTLSEVAEAIQYLGEGKAKGKVVIHIEQKN